MYHFATLFDKNYLTRGLALYYSMQEHIESFTLYVLALDQKVVDYIENSKAENLKAIKLSDVENKYPELLEAKNNRSAVEYYFTLSPVLPLYMIETFPEIDFITTLDADIFFFSNPKPVFDEFKNYSILITKHDFADNLKHLEINGKYNVSFQSFKNNKEGLSCLYKWKNQCIDWCYDRIESNRFADQKYLDRWTANYKNVMVLAGKGAGIAPWNISKYQIYKQNGSTYCNNNKLIFYHFHGLRYINRRLLSHSLVIYKVKLNKHIKNYIYGKYIKSLSRLNKKIKTDDQNIKRINKTYSKKDLKNLIIFDYTFFNFFNLKIINIHLEQIYNVIRHRFFKYTIFLPVLVVKRILLKKD